MPEKTALVGLHDPSNLELTSLLMQRAGFKVTTARTLDDMLQAMGVLTTDSGSAMPKNLFTHYFMDLNLGQSAGLDYGPAQRVYDLVKPYIGSGEAKFLGTSLNFETVELAQRAGIPAEFDDVDVLRRFMELE